MSVPTLNVILHQVLQHTQERMDSADLKKLESDASRRVPRPFAEALIGDEVSIIAEIKRASPSAGALRMDLDPGKLAQSYQSGGAAALSVLTCPPFFHGKMKDLAQARKKVDLPVLCKDFLLERYQILEAAAAGADCVLLIAAALDEDTLRDRTGYARELGLEILHEVHNEAELERVLALDPTLVGVNSRNLKTMAVEPENVLCLGQKIPAGVVGVFESGIKGSDDALRVKESGFQAALVGEALLVSPDPAQALYMLIDSIAGDEDNLMDEGDAL